MVVHVLCAIVWLTTATGAHGADSGRANDESPKRVFVLYDQNRDFAGLALLDQTLTSTLKAQTEGRLEVYTEFMDASRFRDGNEKDYEETLRQFYRKKYAGKKIDLVLAVFGPSLDFLLKYGPELFPDAPIVFCGIDRRELEKRAPGANVTGVLVKREFKPTLDLALKLHPDTRQVYFIAGTSSFNRYWVEQARRELQASEAQLKITYLTDLPMEKLQAEVGRLPPQSIILYLHIFRDGAGKPFNPYEALSLVAQSANAPIYAFLDTYVGFGIVGGFVYSLEAHGIEAAELALRILKGERPAQIPVAEMTMNVSMFDWRQMRRWGISEKRLPPGSIVKFRPPSMWEQYRWYMIVAFVIVIGQALLIGGLVVARARRSRVEAELRESREFMELSTNAGDLGLWVRDFARGDLWVNPRLRTMLGFKEKDEIRFEDFIRRIHPDDRARAASLIERAQQEGVPFDVEFRAVLLGGAERWLTARGWATHDGQGRPLRRMGAVLDITERKRGEEALRESEARFRAVADTAPVMIWMSGTDKLCIFFNKGWIDFTGRTMEEELGNGWAEGVHREDFDRCLEVYINSFDARQEFTMEYRLRRFDGEYCWILDSGVPRFESNGAFLGYIGSCIDITERKRAEEVLRQSEERYRILAETATDVIITMDQNSAILFVNSAVARVFGYSPSELVGRKITALMPEPLRQRHEEGVRRYFDSGKKLLSWDAVSFPGLHKSGREISLEISFAESRVGERRMFTGIMRDVTERRQAELEAARQRTELAHIARVSTMGELAASMAHELNQPLGAILSNAEAAEMFLNQDPPALKDVREILADIRNDDQRAGDVIQRMRVLLRKREMELRPLEINELVRDVVKLLHTDAAVRRTAISADLTESLPSITGDRVHLQQVLLNLMLNGMDAMADKSAATRRLTVRTERNGNGVVAVAVMDAGHGIAPDRLPRLFEPFFTTKQNGMGMGLAIAQKIIEAHGGRIWAENNPDGGATFKFTLPLSKGDSA